MAFHEVSALRAGPGWATATIPLNNKILKKETALFIIMCIFGKTKIIPQDKPGSYFPAKILINGGRRGDFE
jgi:hypothetical protein